MRHLLHITWQMQKKHGYEGKELMEMIKEGEKSSIKYKQKKSVSKNKSPYIRYIATFIIAILLFLRLYLDVNIVSLIVIAVLCICVYTLTLQTTASTDDEFYQDIKPTRPVHSSFMDNEPDDTLGGTPERGDGLRGRSNVRQQTRQTE